MITTLIGDALEQLRTLPDESIHCCVTSPPYWGLRDYSRCECVIQRGGASDKMQGSGLGPMSPDPRNERNPKPSCPICHGTGLIEGVREHQLGLEGTLGEWLEKLVIVFREVRRILRNDGTLWLNVGDSYASDFASNGISFRRDRANLIKGCGRDYGNLRPKNLIGQPWHLAFALQADGWYLRSDIIWAKPNPMPESVFDRPTKAHEYIFLLSRSPRYFYDQEAIREGQSPNTHKRAARDKLASMGFKMTEPGQRNRNNSSFQSYMQDLLPQAGRNSRTVWEIPTQPYPEAHFATFPEELPRRCIKAGTSEKGCCSKCGSPWERIVEKEYLNPVKRRQEHQGDWVGTSKSKKPGNINSGDYPTGLIPRTIGWQSTCSCNVKVVPCVVLDPFAGSGTTGWVARSLGRKAILVELNPQYGKLLTERSRANIPDICEMNDDHVAEYAGR